MPNEAPDARIESPGTAAQAGDSDMSERSWLMRLADRGRSHQRAEAEADGGGPGSLERGAPWRPAWRWFRRPSTGERSRWAQRALDWPLVNYLEAAVWGLVAVTLGVSYYGSYDNLVDVLAALGYAYGPRHVVPIALDAPLTCSVIGQFLLARWKSPAVKRWRLFVVTLITAPLSLAGNALHGALRFQADNASLDLALLDLHHPEVAIRLVAAMVPAIGIILAVAVTELVLRERARLEELREADRYRHTQAETEASAQVLGPTPGAARPTVAGRPERDSTSIAPPRRSTGLPARSVGHQASRRSATEVLAMVRSARERLSGELEREPKDEEVASQVSAAGHPITASRVRTYLAQLRAAERTRSADEDQAKEEVVAWRGR